MTIYLQLVKGLRDGFIFLSFLGFRMGKPRISGQRKMLEREDSPKHGKEHGILRSDGRESLGQRQGISSSSSGGKAGMDAAKCRFAGKLWHFQVMTSEVRSSVSERRNPRQNLPP